MNHTKINSLSEKFFLSARRIKERVYTDLTFEIRNSENNVVVCSDNRELLINVFYPMFKKNKFIFDLGKDYINSEDIPELLELFNEAFSLGMFENE